MMKTETNNDLTCPGCNATFKHASSLSTHKNGNAKKGLKPCMAYYDHVGKEYHAKLEARTLTNEDYDLLHGMCSRILAWIDENKEKEAALPVFDYTKWDDKVPSLERIMKYFPPKHVDREWMQEKFMGMRFEEFIPTLFQACHLNPTEGKEHCIIRIPKVSHDADLEVYDGQYWRPMKIHDMLIVFIGKTHRYFENLAIDQEDNQELVSRYDRFTRWTPDDAEQIEKKTKRDYDEEEVMRTYSYTSLVKNIKKVLLGHTRDAITKLKKDHQKVHRK